MIDDTLVERPLYGGAAHLAFPQRFVDISDFRPVPDHQEVAAPGSGSAQGAPRHCRRRDCRRLLPDRASPLRPAASLHRCLPMPTWTSHS